MKKQKYPPFTGQTDCVKLIRYMALRGAITRLHAQQEFGNGGSITARIADLRLKHGYEIVTTRCVDANGRVYSRWHMADRAQIKAVTQSVKREVDAYYTTGKVKSAA